MDEGATGAQRPAGVPSESGAQMEGDEPFPTHVSARDRRAFAEEVFDRHALEIYRYVLAWTGDRDSAVELTDQVLRTAVARMDQLAEPGTDVEARLVALARTAVARRTEATAETAGAARDAGAFAAAEPVPLLLDEIARLDDARREVLILRQLLGRSTEHAARLLAFDPPVVDELERDACAALWRRLNHAPQTQQVTTWDALTVAAALRQGAASWLPAPAEGVLTGLRDQLLGELDQEGKGQEVVVWTGTAAGRRRLLPTVLAFAVRRRWLLAGCVVSAAIGTVAALSMGGQVSESSPCGASTCVASTTMRAVDDPVASLPGAPPGRPSGPTSSTTRVATNSGLPAMRNRGTQTTGLSTTTTTIGGSTPTVSTSSPRRSTTTTSMRSTTTSTVLETTTSETIIVTSTSELTGQPRAATIVDSP